MRELGWIEGKNIEYELVCADGDVTKLDGLAASLVRQRVDAIVVASSPSASAAQRATKTIPSVLAYIGNAVANHFVESLAKPGGNVTGISAQSDDVVAKLIEILHTAVPSAKSYAILLNENNPIYPLFWAVAQRACISLGLTATRITAGAPTHLEAAVHEILQKQCQAVVVAADGMFSASRAKLQNLLAATHLPVAYGLREHVAVGGLLSYAPDLAANFHYAATFVNKILKGTSPADLPVEQPTNFALVINLKAATELGLVIPQSLLLRADEVIR